MQSTRHGRLFDRAPVALRRSVTVAGGLWAGKVSKWHIREEMMLKAMILGLTGVVIAAAAMADPVEGTWQTQPGDDGAFGHVEMAQCGAALCGTLVRAYDGEGRARASDSVGRNLVWDMQAKGGGAYAGGKIWAPDRDKTYNSKMTLNGAQLEVSGCVLGICRSQTWVRVE